MRKEQVPERRKSSRKEVKMPINFVVKEGVTISGQILDINCYGLKFQFLFNAAEEMDMVDKNLSAKTLTLEIEDFDKKNPIDTPVTARWNAYKYTNRKRIYEVGLTLQLDNTQKQTWEKFYNSL